jgi:hypothetical protein
MDYLGEWGGAGPGHSWAQMALASPVPFKSPVILYLGQCFLPGGKDPGEAPCSNLFLDFVLPRDKQE